LVRHGLKAVPYVPYDVPHDLPPDRRGRPSGRPVPLNQATSATSDWHGLKAAGSDRIRLNESDRIHGDRRRGVATACASLKHHHANGTGHADPRAIALSGEDVMKWSRPASGLCVWLVAGIAALGAATVGAAARPPPPAR